MSGKQKGMGDSPLTDLFTPTAPPAPPPPAKAKREQRVQREQREQREHKATGTQRFTVHLSAGLVERLRRAVFHSPGLTLSGLAEQALAEAVDRLEKKRGEVFPATRGSIRGRPVR